MWFPFFKNKNDDLAEDFVDIHHEVTQRISNKPCVESLRRGVLICTNCGDDIELSNCIPLSIPRCPECDAPNFIPMKIRSYWLFEPLGGGGMGSVYHAFTEADPEVEVAVKILPRRRRKEKFLIESLMKEAQIGYQLGQQQHLAEVYDYGNDDGEYFAAFEYIDGVRLDQIIESPVQRSEKQILLWALQILSAEQHIFDCGYLFRDLKPQNIIIDHGGNVKLFDYGLAISIDDAFNKPSDDIQGSPYYLPPERIVGKGESQCSEIYSLGMVLFHTLAKQTYYSSDEVNHLVNKHVTSLRVANVAGKLPAASNRDIVDILNRMIKRSPQARYQTYKELAADLFKVYKTCA